MRQSLNFIINVDQLMKSPETLKECEESLAKIFEHQILRKEVKTKEDIKKLLKNYKDYLINPINYIIVNLKTNYNIEKLFEDIINNINNSKNTNENIEKHLEKEQGSRRGCNLF